MKASQGFRLFPRLNLLSWPHSVCSFCRVGLFLYPFGDDPGQEYGIYTLSGAKKGVGGTALGFEGEKIGRTPGKIAQILAISPV